MRKYLYSSETELAAKQRQYPMLTITKQYSFEKTGIDEVDGLKAAVKAALLPLQEAVANRVYWSDVELSETEYKGRDGFIPYGHNCGGVEISEIIPSCEQYDFDFLPFGECDHEDCGYDEAVGECGSESVGHLDAKFRVWLKFEGISEGRMRFYLYCGGGNGDAPYFRTKAESTVHEEEFSARSITEFERVAAKRVAALVKKLFKGKAA